MEWSEDDRLWFCTWEPPSSIDIMKEITAFKLTLGWLSMWDRDVMTASGEVHFLFLARFLCLPFFPFMIAS
jgi:hypothetical protein